LDEVSAVDRSKFRNFRKGSARSTFGVSQDLRPIARTGYQSRGTAPGECVMGAAILMPESIDASRASPSVIVNIGAIPILLRPDDPKFCEVLADRYAGFLSPESDPVYEFDIQLDREGRRSDEDARVTRQGAVWSLQRGDFVATWDPRGGHGHIRQCPNPYSIDTVLRIAHSLVLAQEGGFLVHAASAVRCGRAFLFAGVSGAGKTTMARLTPPDATVLTDEISYVRYAEDAYTAYGTPFAGDLARVGANIHAPLDTLYLLVQGQENSVRPIREIDAARALMRHVLFFADDTDMVARVFDSVLAFVSRVRIAQLVFTPDARVWELIR
jgi:hypothetical protein